MNYLWIGLMILLPILAHELGHLIAMRKCGVWVTELGIGLPLPRCPSIGLTFASRKYPGKTFRFSLHPFLLGAFVKPENEESITRLSYHDRAFIYGAGIIGNLVFITLALALLGAMIPESPARSIILPFVGKIPITQTLCFYGAIGTALILWCARPITQYLFPPLAIAALCFVAVLIVGIPFRDFVENSGGVVVLAQLGERFSGNWAALTYFSILVSYLLALTNILPCYPLDGGQTMKLLGEKFFPRAWVLCETFGILFFVFLLIFALAGDIRRIIDLFI